jgi:hypothetical protein
LMGLGSRQARRQMRHEFRRKAQYLRATFSLGPRVAICALANRDAPA